MSWFFKSRKSLGQAEKAMGLVTGSQRSPGLAEVSRELRERDDVSVLDLGASSTENVQFFSTLSDDVTVAGLFQGRSERAGAGQRSDIFRFDPETVKSLPDDSDLFDLVIMWDLLHYFEADDFKPFNQALRRLCRPSALIYLMAANHAPIYKLPIHFRIEKADSLYYTLPETGTVEGEVLAGAGTQMTTRDVEQLMAGFRPLRLFQLRNGMQEFIFRAPARKKSADPDHPADDRDEPEREASNERQKYQRGRRRGRGRR